MSANRPVPTLAVVGAGIGGLAAAYQLVRLAESRDLPIELVVLEAAPRAGGALASEHYAGALLEHGPDTMVTHKPAGWALCERLGLADRLAAPPAGRADILHRGRFTPVPAGFALIAPTRRLPLLASPLLGWRAKVRLLVAPIGFDNDPHEAADESIAAYVRRRHGNEVLERIVEPIVGAITMGDVERLSRAALFPRRRAGVAMARSASSRAPLVALAGGLGQLAEALVRRLPPAALRLGTRVDRLRKRADGFELQLATGSALFADAVLVATPGHAAAALLAEPFPALAAELASIDYASCSTVHLGWRRDDVTHPPRNPGFFVSRRAGLPLVAAGFVDVKFPDRAPAGQVVARAFLGGALRPEVEAWTDTELVAAATRALTPLLGARAAPLWHRVVRHDRALPQPAVDHLALVGRVRGRLAEHSGLELAGGALGAYGLPDSIVAGEAAAARLFDAVERGFERAPRAAAIACDEA